MSTRRSATLGARHEGLLAALFGSDGSPLKAGLMQRLCSMSASVRRAQSWGLALSRSRLGSHKLFERRPDCPYQTPSIAQRCIRSFQRLWVDEELLLEGAA